MREHFRPCTAYRHTFADKGSDPFGPGTQKKFYRDQPSDAVQALKTKQMLRLNLLSKMGF